MTFALPMHLLGIKVYFLWFRGTTGTCIRYTLKILESHRSFKQIIYKVRYFYLIMQVIKNFRHWKNSKNNQFVKNVLKFGKI